MDITEYSMEEIIDPTGILTGKRFEVKLYIALDEEDELYADGGTGLRVIYVEDESGKRIASYHFFDRATEDILDFEMEPEEEEAVLAFCKEHVEM